MSQSPTVDRDRLDRTTPAIPKQAQPVQLPSASSQVAAAASQIMLTEVRYEGATLERGLLDEATRSFIGAPLDRNALQKLADAVSAAYARSDIAFYAVSIPAQTAANGILVVRVIEGRIVEYKLASVTSSTPDRLVDAHITRLMREMPVRKSSIERTLSLLRDIPGQTVQASLRATPVAGELALDLDVERKQVEVAVDLNNRGVVNVTSGTQAQVSITLNGMLREGDSTRLSGYVPLEPDRYQFYTASHTTPIGSTGTTIGLSTAYVRTRTRDLGILGEAKQAGLVLAHPLVRSYKRNLTLTASIDGTNSNNYYLDLAFGGFRTRAVRLGASWSVLGKTSGYGLSTSFSQGISGLGARAIEGYSQNNFRKANLQLTGIKQISPVIAAKVTVRGQYTDHQLPTTERFILGGEGAGLAFRDGFLTADKAAAAGAELSWRVLGSNLDPRGLVVFAYGDAAWGTSYARPLYGLATSNYSLATAGGGIRLTPLRKWTATAQFATPVKSPLPNISKKTRFFLSVSRTL